MNNVTHYQASFTDGDEMRRLFEVERPDAVIHCAAMTNVDECENQADITYEINAYAPARLAEIANSMGAKFIFISTDAVFDGTKGEPYAETDQVNPINVYGKSKAIAEELMERYENNLILRTNMYGFNRSNNVSLSEWVMRSISSGQRITMFYDVLFSPLLVNTLVSAIESTVANNIKGILHIGSSDFISKYEFGIFLSQLMGYSDLIDSGSIDSMDFTAKRSKNMALNVDKALSFGLELPSIGEDLMRMLSLIDQRYPMKLKGDS